MTLAIFLGVFVAMVALGGYAVVQSDRKRRGGRSPLLATQIPSDASVASIVVSTAPDRALQVALEAMHRIGASGVELVDDWVVTGWIGNPWTNIPSRTAYELVVRIMTLPDAGMIQFACQARPRFPMILSGKARSQELTQRLVSEVGTLA